MTPTIEWLNLNAQRAYPFVGDTLWDLIGPQTIQLPMDLVLDCHCVAYTQVSGVLQLISISIATVGLIKLITLQFQAGSTVFDMIVPSNASNPYTASLSVGADMLTLILGTGIETMAGYPDGTYMPTDTLLIEPALVDFLDGYQLISLSGDYTGSVPVDGTVYMQEGYNTVITVNTAAKAITLAAHRGAGAGINCNRVDPSRPTCNQVLLCLNDMYADGNGDIQLAGGNGVEIQADPANHKLIIRAKLSQTDLDCKA